MQQDDLEQLIRLITTEVLKAVSDGSAAETKGSCGCTGDEGSGQKECCRRQKDREYRFQGRVLAASDVETLETSGICLIRLGPETLVTPLARELAKEKGLTLTCSGAVGETGRGAALQAGRTVFIVSGDRQSSKKQAVARAADARGYSVEIHASPSARTDTILKAATGCTGLLKGKASGRLVVLNEEVYPLALQLGRIDGLRPAVCWDSQSVSQSKKIMEANVLVLNDRLLGAPMLRRIIEAWLED